MLKANLATILVAGVYITFMAHSGNAQTQYGFNPDVYLSNSLPYINIVDINGTY